MYGDEPSPYMLPLKSPGGRPLFFTVNFMIHSNKALTLVNPQNGNLAFKIFPFTDGDQFDHLQRLNYYSLILLIEGSSIVRADFSEYAVKSNTLLCFSPYQPFMMREENKLNGIAVNFHPDFFCIHKHHHEVACNGVLFNNIYEPPFVILTEEEKDGFISLTEKMKSEMQNDHVAQYELLVSYLKIFLINASRIKIGQRPDIQNDLHPASEPFILQRLKEAIEQNYRTKHSAGDYADLLHVSTNTLAKVSKSYFNKTLTDLISERIVIEAKRELYLTSKSVKQIAYDLGFSDEYYFSRFFKINTDISPSLYRTTVGFAKGSE